ncbi:MAG TPA: CsbD family protein [Usitatibacter sp.]|nr:CsbD family protein [Usitatibacter sp.]
MNWDRIEGDWKQMKGSIKEKWGQLTDDEFDQIAGKRDMLVGKIQERYGITRDEADRQVRGWEDSYRDEPRH